QPPRCQLQSAAADERLLRYNPTHGPTSRRRGSWVTDLSFRGPVTGRLIARRLTNSSRLYPLQQRLGLAAERLVRQAPVPRILGVVGTLLGLRQRGPFHPAHGPVEPPPGLVRTAQAGVGPGQEEPLGSGRIEGVRGRPPGGRARGRGRRPGRHRLPGPPEVDLRPRLAAQGPRRRRVTFSPSATFFDRPERKRRIGG